MNTNLDTSRVASLINDLRNIGVRQIAFHVAAVLFINAVVAAVEFIFGPRTGVFTPFSMYVDFLPLTVGVVYPSFLVGRWLGRKLGLDGTHPGVKCALLTPLLVLLSAVALVGSTLDLASLSNPSTLLFAAIYSGVYLAGYGLFLGAERLVKRWA